MLNLTYIVLVVNLCKKVPQESKDYPPHKNKEEVDREIKLVQDKAKRW